MAGIEEKNFDTTAADVILSNNEISGATGKERSSIALLWVDTLLGYGSDILTSFFNSKKTDNYYYTTKEDNTGKMLMIVVVLAIVAVLVLRKNK